MSHVLYKNFTKCLWNTKTGTTVLARENKSKMSNKHVRIQIILELRGVLKLLS